MVVGLCQSLSGFVFVCVCFHSEVPVPSEITLGNRSLHFEANLKTPRIGGNFQRLTKASFFPTKARL
jgi:hypothetical protein